MSPLRVLVSTLGSLGDVLPLVPVMQELEGANCVVIAAVNPALGLTLRQLGIGVRTIGQIVTGSVTLDNKSDGWSSYCDVLISQVIPNLRVDTRMVQQLIRDFDPAVVLCGTTSPATRIAAARLGVPIVTTDLHVHRALPGFDRTTHSELYRRAIEEVAGSELLEAVGLPFLAWGESSDTLFLHDVALLSEYVEPPLNVVGFPSWDHLPISQSMEAELAASEEWLVANHTTSVLVVLGSLIGMADQERWSAVAEAIRTVGARGLLIGVSKTWRLANPNASDMRSTSFLPLSRLMARADVIVHHGGIGTAIGAVRAGKRSLVIPISFDQPFNARLIEAAGVGVSCGSLGLEDGLARLVAGEQMDARARNLAARMVPPTTATKAVVNAVLAAA